MQETEKEWEVAKAKAYEDPVKAEEAKSEGNRLFGLHQYPEAVKQVRRNANRQPANQPTDSRRSRSLAQYDEAIRRAPRNVALYTNRAGAWRSLSACAPFAF